MTLLIVIGVMSLAVFLPLLLAQDDAVRKRRYLPLSLVPAILIDLLYLRGFNTYSIFMTVIYLIMPLSLTLILTGIALIMRASLRKESWGVLAIGVLIAGAPIFLVAALFIFNRT